MHYGRLVGPVGFSRTVAIKRLHPQFAKDPEFVAMFLDEARLAARIRHPNVVPTLDVVATQGELFLVMEYVQGESLSRLARAMRDAGTRIPPRVVSSIMAGVLHGLHAAHEARDERGEPLAIVHRDVSPHNVLVGSDGIARVLDFGVAKAAGRTQTTRDGHLKGKLSYMAPEQINGQVTRQTDLYAAAIVLWEALTGDRLFAADNQAAVMAKVMNGSVEAPSTRMIDAGKTPDAETKRGLDALDAVVLRGLERDPTKRFASAREMAIALERCVGLASPSEVGEWVEHAANDVLTRRAIKITEIESSSSVDGGIGHDIVGGASHRHYESETKVEVGHEETHAMAPAPASRPKVLEEVASQMSSISVSRAGDALPPSSSRRRTWLVAAALLFVIATIAVVLVVGTTKTDAPRSSASVESASAPPPPASIPAATTTATASAQADVDAAAAPMPMPSARSSAPTKPPLRAPPPPTAKKPSCDPPYTVDSLGRKHFRTECL